MAKGVNIDGKLSSVIVIRKGPEGPKGIKVNLKRTLKLRDFSQNIKLQSGDIVFVPRKVIRDVNYFATQIIGPLSQAAGIAASLGK